MDVSVVIVSWNSPDLLRDCIDWVFRQTRSATFKVIVVLYRRNLGFTSWITAKVLFLFSNAARYRGWWISSVVTRDPVASGKAASAAAAFQSHLLGEPT
jgi:hypothetical protein